MGIVAADASLGYSKIGIYGLEVTDASLLHKPRMRFGGMSEHRTQPCLLKFAGGDVPVVDRPEADQWLLYANSLFGRDAS